MGSFGMDDIGIYAMEVEVLLGKLIMVEGIWWNWGLFEQDSLSLKKKETGEPPEGWWRLNDTDMFGISIMGPDVGIYALESLECFMDSWSWRGADENWGLLE